MLTSHLYLAPRIKMNGAVPLIPPCLRVIEKDSFALITQEVQVKSRKSRIKVAQFPVYSLVSTPTNAQRIYVYNILCTVSTATYFDVSASSLGILVLLFCYSYKIIRGTL